MILTRYGENADIRYFHELVLVHYCSGVEEEGKLQITTRYIVINCAIALRNINYPFPLAGFLLVYGPL